MLETLLLVGVGILAGFLNIMAGGGSMVSVPVMIFLGMPGHIANATNRVAILAESITSISAFYKQGISDIKLSLSLAACTIPGAIIGAFVASGIRSDNFNHLLAIIMGGVLLLMWFGDKKQNTGDSAPTEAITTHISKNRLVLGHILMVAAGFWGGFIQIGVGFILMPILHRVMGLDLIRTNMHKVTIVLIYTIVALAVFASQVEIDWRVGLYLGLGAGIGGWLGTHVQIRQGTDIIKWILNVVLIAFIIKLLFF
ncbi:MAG: sulfite exporter TauE/SafE family protein [Arenicella sp.]